MSRTMRDDRVFVFLFEAPVTPITSSRGDESFAREVSRQIGGLRTETSMSVLEYKSKDTEKGGSMRRHGRETDLTPSHVFPACFGPN